MEYQTTRHLAEDLIELVNDGEGENNICVVDEHGKILNIVDLVYNHEIDALTIKVEERGK